uniref:FACT complex subunit SSRP1 n=1 Tax=Panagrolaimus sp. PS1159 TaxID=55785 RepID=A0AC35F304_9BILA
MSDNYDVQNVSKEEMGALYNGDMRFTPSGLTYKNRSTGKVFQLSNEDIESVSQNFMANQPGLRFITKDGELHRFANFTEGQLNKLKTYIATKWRRNVEIKENSLKGWNFGNVPIVGKNLQFQVNDALDFEIPLSNVSNCTANKSEAILEFHANDDSAVGLVEMRLHMPMVEGVSEEESPAELLRQAIMKYAAVEAETEQHIMHINPPIRQGQTRYSFIVFEFNKDELAELELSLTDEQLQDTYEGKIERHLNGPLYQIVAKLFRIFVGIKVTVPGGFTLKDDTEAVTCSYKQSHGFLYPMDKGFMYVPKPPIYIRYEEIANVNFARSDVTTKTFDLEISVKGGTSFVFSSVAKDDFDSLLQFCKEKNLPVQNVKNLAKAPKGGFAGLDDDVDPYKERLKSEAAAADSEESDSDEEDEDFDVEMEERKKRQKGDDDSDATDGTEPDEEYDTGSAEEEDSDGEKKKKSSHKKEKRDKEKSGTSSSSRKRGEKKRKDPNAPKRATSAYFHWMNEIRSSITKPGMGVAEVAKEAGRLWKEMSDADKKPYEEKSKEDKERYEKEMKEYKASGGGGTAASSSGKSKSTPKKSSTSASNTSKSSPTKGAKSREFLSSSEDSSDDENASEDEDAKKKKSKSSSSGSKKEEKKEKPSKKKAKTPSSEEESSEASDDSD